MTTSFKPIINSLLENDFYKFTMLQLMLHRHPRNTARYEFLCRNATQYPLATLKDELEKQLDHLCQLHFEEDELQYLATKPYFASDFIEFLRIYKLNRKFIKVLINGDGLKIIAEGPQVHIMMFEIYVLSIVNELYFRAFESENFYAEGRKRLNEKIALIRETFDKDESADFEFFDFSLRRRASGVWQDELVATLNRELPRYFRGTSNVYLAKKYNVPAIGTMAHELFQMYQAVGVQLRQFQKQTLEDWVAEYRGEVAIALTDIVGMDAFLNDFDLFFAKLFDGLRHDSGDPVVWGEKAISHYEKLRIDPKTKRLVFSDGLTVAKAIELYQHFRGRIKQGYGIGTSLGNDMGVKALNIVMKIVECNGKPVAKLSDSPGKTMCENKVFLDYLRSEFNHHI